MVPFPLPFPLVKDGHLIARVQHFILAGRPETVRITKLNRHATQADVDQDRVRAEDKFGNAEADADADLGSGVR